LKWRQQKEIDPAILEAIKHLWGIQVIFTKVYLERDAIYKEP